MEIDHGQLPENGRQLIDAQDGACRKRFFGNSKIHWQKSSGGTRSVFIRAACMAPDTLAIRPRRNGPRQNESWQAAWHGLLVLLRVFNARPRSPALCPDRRRCKA